MVLLSQATAIQSSTLSLDPSLSKQTFAREKEAALIRDEQEIDAKSKLLLT